MPIINNCRLSVFVLANALVVSARTISVSLGPLDHVGDPATDTLSSLGFGWRAARLEVRWLNVKSRNGIVSSGTPASNIELGNGRSTTMTAEERLCLG
jgi:hypothetical protein